jgi:hypothetical protein
MYRERQLASGETEIREPADQASIRPVLRPVSSAPDVEAKSTPERQRRLEPREMPVERGALPLQSWQAAAPHHPNCLARTWPISRTWGRCLVRRLLVDHGALHRLDR